MMELHHRINEEKYLLEKEIAIEINTKIHMEMIKKMEQIIGKIAEARLQE